MMKPGYFCWNELVTTDVEAAKAFYGKLFGWTTAPLMEGYTLFNKDKGDRNAGGLMKTPQPGMPAQWLAYVCVDDVDATAAQVAALGGKIKMPPMDIPTVGRIAVLSDPQGAAIGIFRPAS